MFWILMNAGEDQRERYEENSEYIKVLNMRLRPETCPELNEGSKQEKRMETPPKEFEKLFAGGPNKKYMG